VQCIYYDVTRLIARSDSPTPTGIDRVDINYAYYLVNSPSYDVVAVYQAGELFFILPDAADFINALYGVWVASESSDFDFKKLKKSSSSATKKESKQIAAYSKNENILENVSSVNGDLLDIIIKNRLKKSIYVNTSHHGVGNKSSVSLYQIIKILGNSRITFYLHDIIPIDFPEYVREGDEVNHRNRVLKMAEYADVIFVNSEYTKERFIDFCDKNQVKAPLVNVLIIGVEDGFVNKIKATDKTSFENIGVDYFIYISTIEPRKNHLLLLQLWRQMVLDGVDNIPKLVVLGKRGWNNQNILDLLDRSEYLKGHIVELSGVSDEQMISLLKGSNALLYPSFEEGWGMPLVEAIVANVPVVCSDIPAHRESGQMLVKYLSPIDGISWRDEVFKLSQDSGYRDSITAKYTDYVLPQWKDHFNEIDRIFGSMKESKSTHLNEDVLVSKYFKKSDFCNEVKTNNTEVLNHSSFISKIFINIFFGDLKSEKTYRLIRKFKNDPIRYMLDSKNPILNRIGNGLDNVLKKD